MTEVDSPRRNYWPLVSLVLGTLGLLFALTAPVPFLPFISLFTWPLGLGAMVTGQLSRATQDAAAAAQARWGVRLGCLGWIFQVITSTFKVLIFTGALAYGAAVVINNLINPQPTVIP